MGFSDHVGEFVSLHVVVHHANLFGCEAARSRWCSDIDPAAFAKLVEAYKEGYVSYASQILCGGGIR